MGHGAVGGPLGSGNHALGHFLSHEKRAPRIGIENEIIISFSHIDQTLSGAHARVIDQDIERTGFGLGMGNRRADTRHIVDVHHHHVRTTALAFNLGA